MGTPSKNPHLDSRVTLNKLQLLMMDNGIDVVYYKKYGIPVSSIPGEPDFVNVTSLVPPGVVRWRRGYVATLLLKARLMYGCVLFYDGIWGVWRIREKPKPKPKKRGPKPKVVWLGKLCE